ncbi:MAG: membrane protein insertion efficiency factor YidD [Chitinispirillales bacterium]|jgi:putative membrane protein insertion efficiency factor|nr:membrane protein insertion efficiency factor YidD [Chitinispirillales bacterium]
MAGKSKDFTAGIVYSLIQSFKTVFLMQGAVCKFEPSCSRYAVEAIRGLPLHIAVIKIIWRVIRCNPFSKGGFDPAVIRPEGDQRSPVRGN